MRRARAAARAVPAPLRILLAVVLALGLAWACLLPPLQGPDEVSHFAYTQRLVETQSIPWFVFRAPHDPRPAVSTEVRAATLYSGLQGLTANIGARADWTPVDERIWRQHDARLPPSARADGGYTSAMRDPPLYYVYAAIPYVATGAGSFFDRSFAMRLANLPLLLATVVLSWLLAGELLGRRRWLQTTAAGVVALDPQLVHVGSAISPDALLAALGTAILYLAVVGLTRGLTRGRVLWMLGLALASALTHLRGIPLAAVAVLALLIAWWRQTGPHDRRARVAATVATATGGVGAAAALTVYAAGSAAPSAIRQFGSYLWQFYLPRLPSMQPSIRADWGVRQVYIDRFFGTFAQLDTFLSARLLDVIAVAAVAGIGAVLAALIVQRRALRPRLDVLLVLVLAFVVYMGALHVQAYHALRLYPTDPVLTGRYLLPLIGLMGVAVAVVVRALPRTVGPAAASLLLTACVALQLAALGAVVVRFYG